MVRPTAAEITSGPRRWGNSKTDPSARARADGYGIVLVRRNPGRKDGRKFRHDRLPRLAAIARHVERPLASQPGIEPVAAGSITHSDEDCVPVGGMGHQNPGHPWHNLRQSA